MAKPRPLRFREINEPGVEQREFFTIGQRSEFGRSTVTIECPFCRMSVVAYSWSLAGGGKRCVCGALFGSTGTAYRRVSDGQR